MLYRSLFRFCRPVLQTKHLIPKQIKWQQRNGKICLQSDYPDPHLFFVSPNMDFSALMEVYNKFNIELEFPDGVNPATNIIDFLESEDRPKTIKASFGGGTPYYLRNKASYPYYQSFKKVMEHPGSIFNSIEKKYYKEIPFRQAVVLTQIERTFMKQLSKLPADTLVTDENRAELMMKVMNYFKNDTNTKLWNLKIEQLKIDVVIEKLNDQIFELKADSEKKYQLLKKVIAAAMVTHIVAFGYMIFFVDWLGWDIIEPLTYTIGIFGAISAMIFYIVHRKDSSGDTVKQIFKRFIMKNTKRIHLEQKIAKKNFFLQEKERIRDKMKIFKMRVDYGYFRDINDLKRGELRTYR